LFFCKKEVELRIDQLAEEKKNSTPTYGGLIKLSKDNPTNLKNTDIGNTLNAEDKEFYEMILRKTREDIIKALTVDNYVAQCIEKSKADMR
jgi:hypothetical protein